MTPFLQPNAQDKANRSKFTRPKAILTPSPSGRCSSSVSSPREVPEGHMIGTQHTHRRIVPYRRREVQHTVTVNHRDLRVSSIAAKRRESKWEAVMIGRRYLPRHPASTPGHTPPESPVHKTGDVALKRSTLSAPSTQAPRTHPAPFTTPQANAP